jgi:hypothetical protein
MYKHREGILKSVREHLIPRSVYVRLFLKSLNKLQFEIDGNIQPLNSKSLCVVPMILFLDAFEFADGSHQC